MKKIVISLLAATYSAGALAWVPPSSYLIREVAKKHTKLRGLRVKTRITGTENQIKEIFWLDKQAGIMKGRFMNAADQEIYAYERRLGAENESLASIAQFESNAVKLARALISNGIPVVPDDTLARLQTEEEKRAAENEGIGRLNGKVGWTIGKQPPTFWILKDEFTPLKLFYRPAGKDTEIRFEDTSTTRDFPYSRSITLLKGGSFVLKGEAMEVMVNPDLADMKKINVSGLPALPAELDAPTKNLIENWIQWIR